MMYLWLLHEIHWADEFLGFCEPGEVCSGTVGWFLVLQPTLLLSFHLLVLSAETGGEGT